MRTLRGPGKLGWKPAKPRSRKVSHALRAYALFAASAVRVLPCEG